MATTELIDQETELKEKRELLIQRIQNVHNRKILQGILLILEGVAEEEKRKQTEQGVNQKS